MTDNFKTYNLKEVTTKIGSGSTPRGGDSAYKAQGISLIRSQNVLDFTFSKNGLAFIDEEQAHELRNVTLEQNDVLVNITGDSVARVCQVPNDVLPARVNQHVAILRADTNHLSPSFLKYSLLAPVAKANLLSLSSSGATRKALTKVMLEDFEIHAPSLKEQQAIAEILSALDDKIELNLQMNKTLEEMANALYKHWFVDFGPFKEGKFVESELGMIPDGWEVKKVNELFDLTIGRTPPRKESVWFSNNPTDVKWISIKDMGLSGTFIYNTSEYLTYEAVKKHSVPIIPDNTVVLSFKLTVGRITITTEKMVSNEAIAHFIPKKGVDISSAFTYSFLKNFDYNRLGSTSSIATAVNSQTIKNIDFLYPNKEAFKTFNQNVGDLFERIKVNALENESLKQIRDYLLPKLITGEIRIKGAAKAVKEIA